MTQTSMAVTPGPGPDTHEPVRPDYDGACVSNIVSVLLDAPEVPGWFPADVADANQIVFLVLDGLGWDQLATRRHLTPSLNAMAAVPITTVAPSTTAVALTSITTGMTPGEHGVAGYRMLVDSEVLNVLRWSTDRGDARRRMPPAELQPTVCFFGQRPPVVAKAEFQTSGFTGAHLEGCRFRGYRTPSSMVTHVVRLLAENEPFIYAYYDGIDKVAHEYGLNEFYDAELVAADRLVGDILDALPSDAALVITADHGQLETGDNIIHPDRDVLALTSMQSGEGRFRWLHARPGRTGALHEATVAFHADQAWIFTRDQLCDEGWLGPTVTDSARGRLGDVALAAKGTFAFHEPTDTGPFVLIGRHGSLTSAEMRVPLLTSRR